MNIRCLQEYCVLEVNYVFLSHTCIHEIGIKENNNGISQKIAENEKMFRDFDRDAQFFFNTSRNFRSQNYSFVRLNISSQSLVVSIYNPVQTEVHGSRKSVRRRCGSTCCDVLSASSGSEKNHGRLPFLMRSTVRSQVRSRARRRM